MVTPRPTPDRPELPARIGKYRILREIGFGGMGVVYEAEQDRPRRRVALKLIRSGNTNPELDKRLRHEAQLLGQLDHRGVARVYEVGSATIDGAVRPFLAMELIEGSPIDTHARKEGLGAREVLELVARVSEAVHHAHQKGIIHRDLKPANILIKVGDRRGAEGREQKESRPQTDRFDRVGQPKVLDFGIARATGADIQVTTLHTQVGQILGTLSYMSPEQVEGRADLDVRCDVYGLGVILYELLSGQSPHDLAGKPIVEAARIVKEQEASDIQTIRPELRGDIAAIATKAIEKDRERRYASAAALADDIRRYLRGEPIAARPASTLYQLRKFARRNRGLVVGFLATLLALTAGVVVSTYGFMSARTERDAKTEALELSHAVKQFIADMLKASDPAEQGRDVPVRAVLNNASADIGARFVDRPLVEAELRSVIGQTYVSLSEYARADSQISAAVAIWTKELGADDLRAIEGQALLGEVSYFLGDYDRSLEAFTASLDGHRELAPRNDRGYVESLANVAFVTMQRGDLELAVATFEEALSLANETLDPDAPASIELIANFAMLETRRRRFQEAEALYMEALARSRRVRGSEHPETVLLLANFATVYSNDDRPDEAEPLLREALEIQQRELGPAHSKTLITLGNLAQTLSESGRTDEALTMIEGGVALSIETYGMQSPSTIYAMAALGRILSHHGSFDAAFECMIENLANSCQTLGVDAGTSYGLWWGLTNLLSQGMGDAAATRAATVYIENLAGLVGETHGRVRGARIKMAQTYVALEQFSEAETQLLELLETDDAELQKRVAGELSVLYSAWGRPEEAVRWESMTR